MKVWLGGEFVYVVFHQLRREMIVEGFRNKGIETGTHYKPIHKTSYYSQKYKIPSTEMMSDKIITLPTHPNLSNLDLEYIIDEINKII